MYLFPQGVCPAVGLLGFMAVLFPGCKESPYCSTALHSDHTSLHSHQQRESVSFSLHPLQFVEFLMTVILTGVR